MILEFWNTLWVYFLSRCLFGFKLDTSRLPFSAVVRLIPFYKVDFWYNADYDYDVEHNVMNYKIYSIKKVTLRIKLSQKIK